MVLFSGCATPGKSDTAGFLQRYSASNRLAEAVELLSKGDAPGAAKLLDGISRGGAMPGVTDEALFRLALLSLRAGGETPASAQGRRLLRRLKKEYPASPWTLQAASLVELIGVADELKRQNRNLKGVNQSLTREIGDLNRNLERLKHLDLELEQKVR